MMKITRYMCRNKSTWTKCANPLLQNRIKQNESHYQFKVFTTNAVLAKIRAVDPVIIDKNISSHKKPLGHWDLQHIKLTYVHSGSLEQISFNVTYLDSSYDLPKSEKEKLPVILGLHGCPGCHKDLISILKPFAEDGFRVILPNFPGFSFTTYSTKKDADIFRHSSEEKADFIYNFLQYLNIERLHLIVGHSAGCGPLLVLAASKIAVESLALIAPMHGHIPPKGMEPFWIINTFGFLYYTGIIGKYLGLLIYKILFWMRVGHTSSKEEAEAVIQTGLNAGFGEYLTKHAHVLNERDLPLIYIFADRDPLIWDHVTKEFAKILGVDDEHFSFYDSNGELIHKNEHYHKKGIIFKGRTHTPHVEDFNHVIIAAIKDLIFSVKQHNEPSL